MTREFVPAVVLRRLVAYSFLILLQEAFDPGAVG
jgi:hypothetical protein